LTPRSSALLPVRITTARRPDHIRLSALVRSRSTQFIVHASSKLGHGPPKRSYHFGGVFRSNKSNINQMHVPWARTSSCAEPGFQESAWSCFLLVFYAKLSQPSTRVWPVILTSLRFSVGTGQDVKLRKTRGQALPPPIYSEQTL